MDKRQRSSRLRLSSTPLATAMRALTRLPQPWHAITRPLSYGWENIPRRGRRFARLLGNERATDGGRHG